MSSKVEICNMALSHLASGKQIQNLDTDQSEEANACRTFYDKCVKTSQRDFPWPAFIDYETLGLIEEDPNDEWEYSYRLPNNCAFPIKILNGQREDNGSTAVPYTKATDETGFLIFTDTENAVLKFSKYVTSVKLFDSDYEMALSLLLAFYISPRITSGDANRLGKRAYDAYKVVGEQAKARSLNEIQKDQEPECEMIAARN